jgi:predicted AlkP superfamily phosphohydrolase/phosphomutase
MLTKLFNRPRKKRRLMVMGLDCADPGLVFDQFADDLPHLTQLRQNALWGPLESATPCITVPAWSSMLSSRDPGVLGFYGFRNRADHGYDKLTVATGTAVKEKRVWDYLGEAGLESIVVGVPQTFPVRPIRGQMISCFLTPSAESAFTHPPELKPQVLDWTGGRYAFDVKGFRTEDKDWLWGQLLDMTLGHFDVLDRLITRPDWDFLMWVEMGVDRVHHGFWRHHDPQHRLLEAGNRHQHAIRDYYKLVDERIGRLLQQVDDQTALLVVSDHGVTRMDGGVCLNEWLWKNGWLAFHQDPPKGKLSKLEDLSIDWSKTRAWGDGGYYGRVFLNVAGREPQGIIPPEAYEETRSELEAALGAITDHETGGVVGAVCHRPERIYQAVNGVAPDFIVYFGNLHYRSIGTLGHGKFTAQDNDTGPDDANHGQHGMFIWYDPANPGRGRRVEGHQLMDIAPTLLGAFGLPIPAAFQGRVIA